MTIKEFANSLSGREYGLEVTKAEEALAKEMNYVIVYGYSDDCVEFRGAMNDEVYSYGKSTVLLKDGEILQTSGDECEQCKLWQKHVDQCKKINVKWCEGEFPWMYETDMSHETFNIYEGGEKYCQGIIFNIEDTYA